MTNMSSQSQQDDVDDIGDMSFKEILQALREQLNQTEPDIHLCQSVVRLLQTRFATMEDFLALEDDEDDEESLPTTPNGLRRGRRASGTSAPRKRSFIEYLRSRRYKSMDEEAFEKSLEEELRITHSLKLSSC